MDLQFLSHRRCSLRWPFQHSLPIAFHLEPQGLKLMSARCRTLRSFVDRTLDAQFSCESGVERHGEEEVWRVNTKKKSIKTKSTKGILSKDKGKVKDGRKYTELHAGCWSAKGGVGAF